MLLTCQVIHDIRNGRVPGIRTQTMFRLPQGVIAFLSGPCQVLELRAAGDGSYSTSSTLVWGTGLVGLAALGATAAVSAGNNARARQAAAQNAQVAFRPQFEANLYVTNTGWIFHTGQGVLTWQHGDVDAMHVIGPNAVVLQGKSDRGPITWQLLSPFAELVFVLWALDQHPDHPQLMDGSWLQPGWLDHAHRMGQDTGLRSPILAAPQREITLPGGARASTGGAPMSPATGALPPGPDEYGLQPRYGGPSQTRP